MQRGGLGRTAPRPGDHHDRGEVPDLFWHTPGREQPGGVPAQDEEQLVVRVDPLQLLQCLGRVRDAAPADLHIRHLERLIRADRKPAHLQPLLGAGHCGASMRWLARRNQQNAVQVGAFDGGAGGRQVAEVDRIESAAEDADPHGWYSNSTPAIVTVSPGVTPAASRAVFTPRRSSAA